MGCVMNKIMGAAGGLKFTVAGAMLVSPCNVAA